MSYTTGLDNLQPLFGNTATASISQTGNANKTIANANKTTPYGAVTVADATTVSAASAQISSALTVSDVRSDKVAALQQQIQAGTYHVPSSAVAEKLVGALLE